MLDAFSLQNSAGNLSGDLLFPPFQVYSPLHGPLWRIVRHDVRLLNNQALHRLFVPQVKSNIGPDLLFDGVSGVIAVHGVNSRDPVIYVGGDDGICAGYPLRDPVPQGLEAFAAPYLRKPPLLVIFCGVNLAVDYGANQLFLLGIAFLESSKIGVDFLLQFFSSLFVFGGNAGFQIGQLFVRAAVGGGRFPHLLSLQHFRKNIHMMCIRYEYGKMVVYFAVYNAHNPCI